MMLVPPIFKINQIFWSVQGEGAHVGFPAIFIRLAGCSLRCSYCDNKEAWENGDFLDLDTIRNHVMRLQHQYPTSLLVLTGGEPFEQNLEELVAVMRPIFTRIAIETNALHFQSLPLDWLTLSPKAVSGFRIHPRSIPHISEVKLVADENLELTVIKKIRLLSDDFPIFIQPCHGLPNSYKVALGHFQNCVQAGIPNIRLGIQLHRLYHIS